MKKKPMPVAGAMDSSLEEKALFQLNSGKYKEAIELYKKLLQDSDSSEWRRQLAYCYLQRALAFSAKGMYKEALVLWKNYSQHARPPYENYDHYLTWLIQSKNPTRIQSCLEQLTAQQLDKDYPGLAALLGLLIITEHPEFQQALPQDSAFIAHLKIAQTALHAVQENNPEGVDEALNRLPYRSAFRDFRTLLKAALSATASLADAQSLLTKIPANSLYAQAAGLLHACTLKGSALARAMEKLNHTQRRLAGEIIGLTKKQLEFIEDLSKHKSRLSDKIKFNLAIQYHSLCGSDFAQHFCFAMLAGYPDGKRDFNKNFGSIDAFEENRLKALAFERNDNDYDAEFYWRQCLLILRHDEACDSGLKMALILRRLARGKAGQEQIETLIESLHYDPGDRSCYLAILRYYSQRPDTADHYKQWLGKTLDKFPLDIDVLTLAMQAAMRNKAHKKAGQYALKILKIDPINIFAKQALFSSHLAHARKLMQSKKYPLAEKEIEQAEALKTGKNNAHHTGLMRGLLCFAAEDKKLGLLQITASLGKLNKDPVNANFQAAIEALLTNLPVATLLRDLPPATDHLLSAPELTRFIQLLSDYGQDDSNRERLHKALEKVKGPLKKSVQQQDYDENLLLTLCQSLDTVSHFELLRHCAKYAHAKWHKPIWLYYQVYSEANGEPEKCVFRDCFRLEQSLDKARQEKDHRAMALIGNFLDRYYKAHPMRSMDFLESLFDKNEPDETEDPFERLFGHLPDEIFYKIDKKANSLYKKTSPERLIQDIVKTADQKEKILHAVMKDPDLFVALMMLKAANDLGIDIGVSVEEILNCFGDTKKTGTFPF